MQKADSSRVAAVPPRAVLATKVPTRSAQGLAVELRAMRQIASAKAKLRPQAEARSVCIGL